MRVRSAEDRAKQRERVLYLTPKLIIAMELKLLEKVHENSPQTKMPQGSHNLLLADKIR